MLTELQDCKKQQVSNNFSNMREENQYQKSCRGTIKITVNSEVKQTNLSCFLSTVFQGI